MTARALALCLLVAGVATTPGAESLPLREAPTSTGARSTAPCGTLTYHRSRRPTYRHVVVIMNENTSPGELTAERAPFLSRLRRLCGSEGFMHAATHYSDPNYMAATSGVPQEMGVRSPSDNIFHQVQRGERTWKSYQQSMTTPCGPVAAPYTTWHDPAHWYDDLRTPVNTCSTQDVPLYPALKDDLRNNALPRFAWITPDECHNMHWDAGCPGTEERAITTGDAWLEQKVSQLVSTRSYRRGATLVIITWDEGDGPASRGIDCTDPAVYSHESSCRIPTFVLSPYIVPGARDTRDHNLYSLLATIEDVLGYPRLGRAVGEHSLRSGLRF